MLLPNVTSQTQDASQRFHVPLRRYLNVRANGNESCQPWPTKRPKEWKGTSVDTCKNRIHWCLYAYAPKTSSIPMRTSKQKIRERARQGQGPRRRAGHAKGGPAISLQLAATIARGSVRPEGAKFKTKSPKKKQDKTVCQEVVSVNPYFYISSGASSKPLAQRKKKPVLPSKIIHEEKVKKRLWCLMREHASGEV